jgi:hypothetical protein
MPIILALGWLRWEDLLNSGVAGQAEQYSKAVSEIKQNKTQVRGGEMTT